MKKGDLVSHELWGKAIVVQQQGVVDRWCIRLCSPIASISDNKDIRFVWGSDLEVLSESR